MNLIFFGIQGSGKGTQAKLLASNSGYAVFETGGELRRLATENSDLGRKVKETIESGLLVSADLVLDILQNFINENSEKKIIFDGIPRNDEQLKKFEQILIDSKIEALAIHFKLERDEAFKRLLKRAQIENRADDNEESINRRIEIFETQTTPLIEHYRKKGKLMEIDASPSIEEVYADLTQKLANNYGS